MTATVTATRATPIPRPVAMLDVLEALGTELRAALSALLERSQLHDINSDAPGGLTMVGACNFWNALPSEAQPVLRAARDALAAWTALSIPAVAVGDRWRHDEFASSVKIFDQIVDRSERAAGLWESTVDEVRHSASSALDEQLTSLRALGVGRSTAIAWLPDTNALIFQPDLSQWPDEDATIVVTPPILSELDKLKEGREGAERAAKANAAIGSLNEMGRRGDTSKGVRVHGRLMLREIAVDPDMSQAPKWLRADVIDDRLIASALELAFREIAAPLLLVTRDRNLKNKARQARLACAEPGELGVPAAVQASRGVGPVIDAVFSPMGFQNANGTGSQLLEIVNLTEKPLRLDQITWSPPAWIQYQPQTFAKGERKEFVVTFTSMPGGACIDLEIRVTPTEGSQVALSRRFILDPNGFDAER